MIDQSLITYIKQNFQDGFSENEIRQALLGVGWGAMDIEAAFMAVSAKPRPQSMDILEKELLPASAQKPGVVSKLRRLVIPSVVVIVGLPLVSLGGLWAYERYGETDAAPEVRSAMTDQVASTNERMLRNREIVDQIENLQTALATFYNANKAYPQTLEELPSAPENIDDYLYQVFGEERFDYSLTFLLEADYGTLSAGLHSVNPGNIINAAVLGMQEQYLTGVFGKSPTPELRLSELGSYAPGDEVTINIQSSAELTAAILVTDFIRLMDNRAPHGFTFTAPHAAGLYSIKIFGFAKDGSIWFQIANLTINP